MINYRHSEKPLFTGFLAWGDMSQKHKIAIIGDGGWGTALAIVSDRKGNTTTLWSAFPEYAKSLREKRENSKFLKGIPLSASLNITSDLNAALADGDMIIFAVPTQFIRNVIHQIDPASIRNKLIVSVAKGLEKNTLLRPSEIFINKFACQDMVVLSGPSHAEEVARNIPTCVSVASRSIPNAKKAQEWLMDPRFRIYASHDVIGLELGGALKNVIAIAGGACDGLQFGSNTKAALLSRGLAEMTQLAVKMGAQPKTLYGLAGLGDLVTTCISEFGRNRRVGELLGQGKSIQEILAGMEMVAEGVETAKSVIQLADKYQVEMPIAREVYSILFEGKSALRAVEDLMCRDPKTETE